MQDTIKTMIELQRYNDNCRRADSEITKAKAIIGEALATHKAANLELEKKISMLKAKKKETALLENEITELDVKVKKISAKMLEAHNSKELEASQKELAKVEISKDEIEEKALEAMEEISQMEDELPALNQDFEKLTSSTQETEKTMKERIERFNSTYSENKSEFDSQIATLPPQLRGRFTKLASSSDGKAIVELHDGTCSGCNFKIPTSDVSIATKGEILNCSTCGKFLYLP